MSQKQICRVGGSISAISVYFYSFSKTCFFYFPSILDSVYFWPVFFCLLLLFHSCWVTINCRQCSFRFFSPHCVDVYRQRTSVWMECEGWNKPSPSNTNRAEASGNNLTLCQRAFYALKKDRFWSFGLIAIKRSRKISHVDTVSVWKAL